MPVGECYLQPSAKSNRELVGKEKANEETRELALSSEWAIRGKEVDLPDCSSMDKRIVKRKKKKILLKN